MINKFNEDTWSPEQRALDALITRSFEAVESVVAAERKPNPVAVAHLKQMLSQLTHPRRVAHWNAEFQRIGITQEEARN